MKKVTVKCYINKSTSILAGKTEFGDVDIPLDPALLSEAQRTMLVRMNHQSITLASADATTEALIQVLQARVAEEAAKKAKSLAAAEKITAEYLALPLEKRILRNPHNVEVRRVVFACPSYLDSAYHSLVTSRPEIIAAYEEAKRFAAREDALLQKDILAQQEVREAAAAAKVAEKQAAAERREQQLSSWVAAHGTGNQKGRHALGLLPDEEIIDAIRAKTYAALKDFPRYEKIKYDEVKNKCENERYDAGNDNDVDCEVTDAPTLAAAEYDRMVEIKSAAPIGSEIKALFHTCTWDCGNPDHYLHAAERKSIRVGITVGELSFSREYACN